MESCIKLIDALNLMDAVDTSDQPIPFSIRYMTVDGEEVYIEKGIKCIGKKGGQVTFAKPIRSKKKPNHFKNATRNIYIPQSGQIRKCKIRLITQFNGQKVVY